MTEIANPIETSNSVAPSQIERSAVIARRNTLVKELLAVGNVINTIDKVEPMAKVDDIVELKNPTDKIEKQDNEPSVDPMSDRSDIWTIHGVHINLFDYFGINAMRANEGIINKLQYIHNWTLKQGKTFRDGMLSLNHLDNKLGNHEMGEAKIHKLYNHLWLRNGNA